MEWYVLRKKDNSKVWVVRADKVKVGINDRVVCVCTSQQEAELQKSIFIGQTETPPYDSV